MTRPKRFFATGVLAAAIGAAFLISQMTSTRAANAAAAHAYTLRIGDKVAIPAISQVCSVSTEGGSPDLSCERPRNVHHQVTIFRNSILVWKVGHPDRPVWSGKP